MSNLVMRCAVTTHLNRHYAGGDRCRSLSLRIDASAAIDEIKIITQPVRVAQNLLESLPELLDVLVKLVRVDVPVIQPERGAFADEVLEIFGARY